MARRGRARLRGFALSCSCRKVTTRRSQPGSTPSAHRPRARRPARGPASPPTNGSPTDGCRSSPAQRRRCSWPTASRSRRGPSASTSRELAKRADHRCAATLEEFRAERRAVTREGQVRSGERHDKDDRHRVDDPRRWVLGWANERKIAALRAELDDWKERAPGRDRARERSTPSASARPARRTHSGVWREFRSWQRPRRRRGRDRVRARTTTSARAWKPAPPGLPRSPGRWTSTPSSRRRSPRIEELTGRPGDAAGRLEQPSREAARRRLVAAHPAEELARAGRPMPH